MHKQPETAMTTSSHQVALPVATRQAIEAFAPGRVNLLGEHTDYTGGMVLPMAVPFTTRATLTPNDSGHWSFTSAQFEGRRVLHTASLPEPAQDWSDYAVGVLRLLVEHGLKLPPFHLHLDGSVPFGAGLSSSASVEVATACALLRLAGERMTAEKLAQLCRRAENEFAKSPCGIMDQFVIVAAKAGHALMLDTGTLAYQHLPLNVGKLAEARIVICNSMVRHSVAAGEYSVRHRQVMEGQAALAAAVPGLRSLGTTTLEQLEHGRGHMSDISYRRCRHIVSENVRVELARVAMFAGDPVALGRLMRQSHQSQRDDFECSCQEVDFLVETAAGLRGCYGARLTGGGFGGCIVALVAAGDCKDFAASLRVAYQKRFGIAAETYVCEAVDGAMQRNWPTGVDA
jgi:galactokinase